MPVSECSRRRKNERPSPARNGATPPLTVVLVELGADAKRSLDSQKKMAEPFIMLVGNEPSQGRELLWALAQLRAKNAILISQVG